jgi:hypothetical protein
MSPSTPCHHCKRTPKVSETPFPISGCCVVRSYCSSKCHRDGAADHKAASQAASQAPRAASNKPHQPPKATMELNLETFIKSSRHASSSESIIAFVETNKMNIISGNMPRSLWGPYVLGDAVIENIRALLEFEHCQDEISKFNELFEFASLDAIKELTTPLPCGHDIIIKISHETNIKVATALCDHQSTVSMSMYHLTNAKSDSRITFTTKDAAYQYARDLLGTNKSTYKGPGRVEITGGIIRAFEVDNTRYTRTILTVQPLTVQVDGSIFINNPIKIEQT